MSALKQLLAFAAGALVLAPVSLARAERILTPPEVVATAPYHVSQFSISPGDSSIAFTVANEGGTGAVPVSLWTVPRTGHPGLLIDSNANQASLGPSQPAWNQDGFIGYVDTQIQVFGSGVSYVGKLKLSDTGELTLPGSVKAFSWGPDPSDFVYHGQLATLQPDVFQNVLFVGTLQGGAQAVFNCQPNCDSPQWNPADNVIAYSGVGGIFLINPDGSGNHLIIPDASGPVWSPSTGLLAFNCGGSDICTSNEDGSKVVNVTNGAGGLMYSDVSWSSDESLLLMVAHTGFFQDFGDLYVVPPDGAIPPQQITSNGNAASPQFSPDVPDELFFVCNHGANDDLCVLQGIGSPGTNCNATTCSGCCSDGICLPGTFDTACGVNGATCTGCTGGKACSSLGTCVNPNCNIVNCPNGCCDSSGVCQNGTSKNFCGTAAGSCERCVSTQICDGVERICKTQLCSAATCPNGCCGTDGQCHNGTSDSTCGSNGFACTSCTGNSHCSTSRICQAQGCNISNCTNGCCDSGGVCRSGDTASACGSSGFACLSCGQSCDANSGQCTTPSACSGSSCNGCCGAGDNQCHAGNTSASCGYGGFTCQSCGSFSSCSNGFCQ